MPLKNGDELIVDLSGFSSGMYILELESEKVFLTRKNN